MKTAVSKKEKQIASAERRQSGHVFFKPFLQSGLTVNRPIDIYEQEADAMADKVMRMHVPQKTSSFFKPAAAVVQRECRACGEDEKKIHRKESNVGEVQGNYDLDNYINTLGSSGQPLPETSRQFFEPHFGHDFSNVRIHNDPVAAKSAGSINARAYTTGNNIVFNAGQYLPDSDSGKKLLAHELTHVVQQNKAPAAGRIQKCDAAEQAAYDTTANHIRTLPLYLNPPVHNNSHRLTPAQVHAIAENIMSGARTRNNCLYYINHLQALFSTPERPPGNIGADQGPELTAASQREQARLRDPQALQDSHYEENLSAGHHNWTHMRGRHGIIYDVDRTDLLNIVVRVRVHLTGDPARVNEVRSLEDAIEKHASAAGYAVNLEFVDHDGPNVFRASVNPGAWPSTLNWSGTAFAAAHELNHFLGLHDRYNYIDDHSANPQIDLAWRLDLFRREFNRSPDPNSRTSIMGNGNLVTDADVCQVVQAANPAACVAARQAIRQPAVEARDMALGYISRIRGTLSGITTGRQLDPYQVGQGVIRPTDNVRRIFGSVFLRAIPDYEIRDNLDMIAHYLQIANFQAMTQATQACHGSNLYFQPPPVLAIFICPGFGMLSQNNKINELLRIGHLIYQNIGPAFGGSRATGVSANDAEAANWGTFVIRAFNEAGH